jgi:cytochrome c553
MTSVVSSLTPDAMREAAEFYASLPPRPAEPSRDASAISRGAAIALRGIPDLDIPACAECHGPNHRPKNPTYPRLASQYPGYLAAQLRLFRERGRGGSPNVTLMETFVDRLRPEHVHDVTMYYATVMEEP